MTLMEFVGCSLIAFGPPLSMFIITIAKDPVRIIILIASAFFWLLSLLISSLWWYMVYPLKGELAFGAVFSVLFQELFRYFVYLILRKAEGGLKKVTDGNTHLIDNKHILAYVAGLGFGVMSGAFALINVLADSVGPGTVGLRGGGDSPLFFITSSLTTLCFILLNTAWGVIFFHALDSKNLKLILYVIVTHVAASLLTLLNAYNLYWASILPNYLILLVTGWIAFRSAGGRLPRTIVPVSESTANSPRIVPVEVTD